MLYHDFYLREYSFNYSLAPPVVKVLTRWGALTRLAIQEIGVVRRVFYVYRHNSFSYMFVVGTFRYDPLAIGA